MDENPPESDPGTPSSLPSFKDYRRKKDPLMVPDRGFRKQLKCLDKELEVVWNWGLDIWEIWRFPEDGGEAHHVLSVTTKGKTYRELGADVLLKLQESWQLRNLSVKQLVAYFDELDEQERRRKRKEFKEKIEAIALDTRNYVSGVLQIQVPKKLKIGRIVANG